MARNRNLVPCSRVRVHEKWTLDIVVRDIVSVTVQMPGYSRGQAYLMSSKDRGMCPLAYVKLHML